jgi:hypothetical protein
MKKYKTLFWIAFSLIIILTYFFYLFKDYYETEIYFKKLKITDLKEDIRIINEVTFKTNKSKYQIDSILEKYVISDNFKRNGDTIYLNNSFLIVNNDTLNSIGVK